MKALILLLIRLYQITSFIHVPFLRAITGNAAQCRFTPTCSYYTYGAVEKFGAIKGLSLGLRRIARCRPGMPGGNDPVPNVY